MCCGDPYGSRQENERPHSVYDWIRRPLFLALGILVLYAGYNTFIAGR